MVATYEVKVAGAVPDGVLRDVLRELGGATVALQSTRSVVTVSCPDQAALHGILQRLHAFGLELVELRAVPSPDRVATEDES
jgi:hypothetical protein